MQSPQDLATARIVAQGLTTAPQRDPHAVVRRLLTMQGQALPGVLASVALRTGSGMAEVRAAVNRGELVRSWTQRGTIHLTAAQDLGWILNLTGKRSLKSSTSSRERLGITSRMIDQASDSLLTHIDRHGPVSRAEITELWEPLGVNEVPGRNYRLVVTLMNMQLIVYGPLAAGSISDQLITSSSTWLPAAPDLEYHEAIAQLAFRYFTAHGPATLDDLVRWIALPKTHLRAGIAALGDSLASFSLDGANYYFDPGLLDLITSETNAHAPLLLPGFDELILGYKDRSMNLHPDHEIQVVPGRNGVFRHTIIDQARARGTWSIRRNATGPPIETAAFPGEVLDTESLHALARNHPLVADDWKEVTPEPRADLRRQ